MNEGNDETEHNSNSCFIQKTGLYENKNIKGSKGHLTNLHVIEDVTESKEISQRRYDSFKQRDRQIFLKDSHIKKKFQSNGILEHASSNHRNNMSNSDLIKSCSENISQILDATLKLDEEEQSMSVSK